MESNIGNEKSFFRAIRALSNPNRLKILLILERHNLTVNQISQLLRMKQPVVSRYLSILKDAEVVENKIEGRFSRYRLATESWIQVVKNLKIIRMN